MIYIYILAFLVLMLFIFQIFTISRVFAVMRQMNSLLMEIRILFKSTGVYYFSDKKKVVNVNTCQYCKYRMSFIQVTNDFFSDHFYYRCKLKNTEITLADTCENFDRDPSTA